MSTAASILAQSHDAHMFEITPDSDNDMDVRPDVIWSGAPADLIIMTATGTVITLTAATGLLPVPGIRRVMAGSSADLIGIAYKGFR